MVYAGENGPITTDAPGIAAKRYRMTGGSHHRFDADRESYYSLYLLDGDLIVEGERIGEGHVRTDLRCRSDRRPSAGGQRPVRSTVARSRSVQANLRIGEMAHLSKASLVVVPNWFEELRRLVPTN